METVSRRWENMTSEQLNKTEINRQMIQNFCPEFCQQNSLPLVMINAAKQFFVIEKTQLNVKGEYCEGVPNFSNFIIKYETYDSFQPSGKPVGRYRLNFAVGDTVSYSDASPIMGAVYQGDFKKDDSLKNKSSDSLRIYFKNGIRLIIDLYNNQIGMNYKKIPIDSNRISDYPAVTSLDQLNNIAEFLEGINTVSDFKVYSIEVNKETNEIAIRCKGGTIGVKEKVIILPLQVMKGNVIPNTIKQTIPVIAKETNVSLKRKLAVIDGLKITIPEENDTKKLVIGDKNLSLTPLELKLLFYFCKNGHDDFKEVVKHIPDLTFKGIKTVLAKIVNNNFVLYIDENISGNSPIQAIFEEAEQLGIMTDDFIAELKNYEGGVGDGVGSTIIEVGVGKT